ncbi:MAG: Fic family protein [Flavobacteriia bacterium]|nr:Fic family protein [Flavobacteriia bacterium]
MENNENLIKEYNKKTKGVINYYKHTLFVSTFHSTSIEGSTLTENQVIDLLDYGKTVANKPFEHHLMVTDHYKAIIYTMNLAKNKTKLSVSELQNISALIMQNTGKIVNTSLGSYDISKGEFRKSGVFAGKRQFPDAKKVPELIKNMLQSFNKELNLVKSIEDKIKLSFKIHFDFVSIHPFGDGNGRVSRLLMNYVQNFFNLPLCVVSKNSRLKYIEALEKTRKTENIDVFYKFMFAEYSKFLKSEIKKII